MEKILFLVGILFLIVAIKILKQDFLSPAVINIYWNILFFIGAVVIFDNGIEWSYLGLWWGIASCFLFLIGQTVGGKIKVSNKSQNPIQWKRYIGAGLVVIIFLGICNSVLYLRAYGYSIKALFDIRSLISLNAAIAYDRYYSHEVSLPAISSIFSMAIYLGSLIGGYCFQFKSDKKVKAITIATLIPILLLAIITNGKVGVIASAFLWFIGWVLYSLRNSDGKIIDKKIIGKIFFIGILGIAFLDLTMLLRIGSIDRETQLIVNGKLQEYAFGQVEAFSYWLTHRETKTLGVGSNTYMFLTNWLGLTVRKQGVYDLIPGIASNIFTQNRGIVMDYGVLGGLVYWMILGFFSGILYKKIRKKSSSVLVSTFLGAIYFQVLYGFIISPWIYSSYALVFVGFAMFLWCIKKVR